MIDPRRARRVETAKSTKSAKDVLATNCTNSTKADFLATDYDDYPAMPRHFILHPFALCAAALKSDPRRMGTAKNTKIAKAVFATNSTNCPNNVPIAQSQ
ncbi:hypothetical protein SE18_21075 [Herpetosiphon geysericola]|uniref:Uncharacterized protein n=1 Tax=Herpetosiphon geysericola TaxID=70996 RepID=A0A0P6YG37_9CHLR|nr:hypothetical protein SE18_21075 [Herpetosiphon geysericola]